MAGIDLVTIAGWNGLEWLRHAFSTRAGGHSAIYGGQSLNLGWTKEDDPALVKENRKFFVENVAGASQPMRLVTVRQIHSGVVKVVGAEALHGSLETQEGKAVLEGDGLVTDVAGLLLAVGTADCVPVFVVDTARRAVGTFHAGWRGTVARISEQGIATMRRKYGSQPQDLIAAIGPAIGACCYAVGEEVRDKFASEFTYAPGLFRTTTGGQEPQFFVDLWEANRRQLLDAGVSAQRITVIGECTACSRTADGTRKYFSHRAEHGSAGRMLNVVGIV